jgi:hypothetical protein
VTGIGLRFARLVRMLSGFLSVRGRAVRLRSIPVGRRSGPIIRHADLAVHGPGPEPGGVAAVGTTQKKPPSAS